MLKRHIFRNGGSIFILALWALCVLSIFAVVLGGMVSQEINAAAYFQNKPRARYLADAGIKCAQYVLKDDVNGYDSLNEVWNTGRISDEDKSIFKDIRMGDGTYSIAIVDEERKVNINTASHDTLERLFCITGGMEADEAHVAASSIIDWRDVDIIPLEGGAEDGYYKSLERPYRCKNEKFQVPEELLLVRGVTEEAFLRVRDSITVYGDGKVNINTATWNTLCALGMSGKLADKIILYREGRDHMEGTKDDNIMQDQTKIAKELIFGAGLNMEEADRISEITTRNLLSIGSNNFSVFSEGKISRRAERITCVTDRGKNIEYWRE